MIPVPRRPQKLTVALPGSLTKDIPHLREKTSRIGLVGRTLAIFRVEEVLIYNDQPSDHASRDPQLFEKILRYQETPQYLRRLLFPMDPDLQFTGILPPLRIPSHPDRIEPGPGQIREGLVVATGRTGSRVEAGYTQTVNTGIRLPMKKRVTVRITRVKPTVEAEMVELDRLRIYWGYKVTREDASLADTIKKAEKDLTVSTSKKGRSILDVMTNFRPRWLASKRPLVLFGSPTFLPMARQVPMSS